MGLSNIQWTHYTFNPWLGCRKVAPECLNCYIVTTPPFRFRKLTHGAVRTRTAESTWKQPLAWNRAAAKEGTRRRVFCASLSDWLDDESVPIEWLCDLLKLIRETPHLDWLLLTKRPQNWKPRMLAASKAGSLFAFGWLGGIGMDFPPNVWIGISAGADQAAALAIPARIHFLSCEPMLKPMDTTHAAGFSWIIFGGESGKQARPVDIGWIRRGMEFCAENEIACFVKQMGAKPYFPIRGNMMRSGTDEMQFHSKAKSQFILDVNQMKNFQTLADSHGGDMEEWPEDLRVREFPT